MHTVSTNQIADILHFNDKCYYFDGIIRFCNRDIDFSDILLDKKLCKK